MSIVLVVIGLIVGGILTGRDLIDAAAQRAQIAQIEKYNTAVRTFQNKYGFLPGDIPSPYATNFGFQARGQYGGEGDGNGLIEGNCENSAGSNYGMWAGCGELAVLWQDLSTAGLIDANIPTGANQPNISDPITGNCCVTVPGDPGLLNSWLPTAKLGNGQYVYIMSVNSTNYFVVQKISLIGWDAESTGNAGAALNAMTVQQAYNIDKKTDDGFPQSGSIIACDADYDVASSSYVWAAGSSHQGMGGTNCAPATTATSYQTYNCYDNNGVAGIQNYSVTQNANAPNCALSFMFQ